MKLHFIALASMLVSTPALAHDFWIQPLRFQVEPGAALPVTFQVGHGKFRERWSNNDRITLLGDFFQGSRRDRRGDLRSSGPADLVTSFAPAGLHVLGMQSNYSFSELPAVRFKDYAKEEGLALILAARERGRTTNKAGRERYSRRAKALIQVGQQTASGQALATRPIGLKLEIVPDRNPYALGANRMLPVHVLYNGRRLPNATVKLTNLRSDERPVAVAVTDRQGQARFRVPASGEWLLNVVWGEPVTNDPRADFDTTFSSLTFGYAGR
ncbi:MAG: DUF4198 domain-containing protein [Sphingomonas sp.]|nr:DUF4198 domain-containing protein [Sphingomonas sp.]